MKPLNAGSVPAARGGTVSRGRHARRGAHGFRPNAGVLETVRNRTVRSLPDGAGPGQPGLPADDVRGISCEAIPDSTTEAASSQTP